MTPARYERLAARAVDALTIVTLVGYTLYSTVARLWEWDFWAIWGLKARVFVEVGGIDWAFLRSPNNAFCHPDYPLLVPLDYAYVTLLGGAWNDRWLGLMFVAWGTALLLVIRDLASREAGPLVAAVITFASTAFSLSHFIGLAEAAVIALGGAGLLFLRRGFLEEDPAAVRTAAVLLGLAASSKNEGIALLVAAIGAAAVHARFRPRLVTRLWPAIAISAPWLIARAALHLRNDVVQGDFVSRIVEHIGRIPAVLQLALADLPDGWMWVLMLVALLLAGWRRVRDEKLILIATAVQICFYLGAYLLTPHDLSWHVGTSWPRLTRQIGAPLLFVVMLMLARTWRGGEDAAHAEARSVS